jgi:glycosyltransferase involved in cell wall biosynthesis
VHLTSVHYPFDTRIYHRECKSLAAAGYKVTLIAPLAEERSEVNGVRLRPVEPPRNRHERLTRTVWSVYRAAVKEDASIYHFHDPELMPVGALLKLHGKRVIYDVHEDYAGTMRGKWIPDALCGAASAAVSVCEATLGRVCDRIIAATPHIAAKFPRERTRLVQNFPSQHELALPDPLPYEQREPIVVYVGWLGDNRGIGTMAKAVALAAREVPMRLLLAGRVISGARAEFGSSINAPEVEFLGFLDRPQLAQLMARARIGLITHPPTGNSVHAQPTKLFEYMSGGLPVLASNFPAVRRIVDSTSCGLVVNPLDPEAIAQALVWLLRHPQKAAEMGNNGKRAIAEKYNWERESQRLIATYEELLAS